MNNSRINNGQPENKYRIHAASTDYVYADVWATSLERAEAIARDLDGGEFKSESIRLGDWEILEVLPVEED